MERERTILIADDAAMFRELGALFLSRAGRVVTANNGYEALDLARRERPVVVVADLDMPCLGGDGLCLRLREEEELAETAVILMISGDAAEDRARAVRAGADDIIAKPISRTSLLHTVNRFLRGGPRRGQTRVEVDASVHLYLGQEEHRGMARNLSRGGMFVEAEAPVAPGLEVELEFELPDARMSLAPTAEVMWRREQRSAGPPGIGLRFLAMDGQSAREIDSFVYERSPSAPPHSSPGSAGGAQ